MKKPSSIGELTCIGIDLGNLPPYISDVATRLEVSELEFEECIVDTNLEPSPVKEVKKDLLEGFEYFGKQLELSEGADGATERMDEADPKQDGVKTYKTTKSGSSSASKWKSIVNSIAKQVSQLRNAEKHLWRVMKLIETILSPESRILWKTRHTCNNSAFAYFTPGMEQLRQQILCAYMTESSLVLSSKENISPTVHRKVTNRRQALKFQIEKEKHLISGNETDCDYLSTKEIDKKNCKVFGA
ncbi:hypothetical protein RHGRI_012936 [Rhododendron griersonianum]|uniref:Uncharacterized protein n=1 Tax=Rhododendron griersonianum TaxID=479676 RepID=A0AAV6K3W2_9ERIC|nr:hypothetical protein RHGRI_012936 [Rhododendron griersonianum]